MKLPAVIRRHPQTCEACCEKSATIQHRKGWDLCPPCLARREDRA